MAYQTGVAHNKAALIAALRTFCVANGFEMGDSWEQGAYRHYQLKLGGVYFHLADQIGSHYLWLNTSIGVHYGGTLTSQPGAASWSCRVDNLSGPYVGYHFFCDGAGVNVAVEVAAGVFVHFNFGELQKNGEYEGGQYVTGLAVDINYLGSWGSWGNHTPFDNVNIGAHHSDYAVHGHVRTPVAGPVASIGRLRGSSVAWSTGLAPNAGRPLVQYSPNTFNGRAVLVPINIVQGSSGLYGPYYQLGTVGNARFVNIANLAPKDVVNTDWMVFPISQKNGPATTYLNTGNYGLAYRK